MATKTFKIGLSATDKTNMAQDIREQIEEMLFNAYSSSSTYEVGDYVVYNDTLYRCTTAVESAESFDNTKWTQATLQDLVDDVNGAVASVNNKANVDGNYPTMTVGLAESLVATKGETEIEGTGEFYETGYNDSTDGVSSVDSGFATLNDIEGNSVAYNQLVQNGNFADTSSWEAGNATFSVSNNVATMLATSQGGTLRQINLGNRVVNGHKYIVKADIKLTTGTTNVGLFFGYSSPKQTNCSNTTDWQTLYINAELTSSIGGAYCWVFIRDTRTSDWDEIKIKNVQVFDLTRYNIDTTNVDTAIAELRKKGVDVYTYNEYNLGAIKNSQPTKIITRGINQWDEQWEVGGINGSTGLNEVVSTTIRSKNYIGVVPNTTYYFRVNGSGYIGCRLYDKGQNFISSLTVNSNSTFTIPSNCYYLRFAMLSWYGTTYNNDICINVSNANYNGTYYAYEEHEYSLTLPIMRSAGSVKDNKSYQNIDFVDLGTLSWIAGTNNLFYAQVSGFKNPSYNSIANVLCPKYVATSKAIIDARSEDKVVGVSDGIQYIYIIDTDYSDAATFKTAMSGVILNYELATPVEQSDVSIPDNIEVINGGTIEITNASDYPTPPTLVLGYQKNLKTFLEDLGNREDIEYDPSQIASKKDLGVTWALTLSSSDLSGFIQAQVAGGCFYVVCSALGNGTSTTLSDITIDLSTAPSGVASSIYDDNGDTADQSVSGDVLVSLGIGRTASGTMKFGLYHTGANELTLRFEDSLASNTEKVDCRTYLTVSLA